MQTFATDPAMEAPGKVAEECKAKITSFQELLPLMTAICNAGLHDRHWEQIAAVVGFDVKPDEVTSLRRLLDYNIQDHIKVSQISEASKMAKGDLITCGDDAWLYCQHVWRLLVLAFAFAGMQKNQYALKTFLDCQSLMLCICAGHEPVSDWSTCTLRSDYGLSLSVRGLAVGNDFLQGSP